LVELAEVAGVKKRITVMLTNNGRLSHIRTRIAGVFYDNADGSSRQEAIRRCEPFDRVVLRPEPRNPYDSNAMAVDRQSGEQLGYLPAPLAKEIRHAEQQGLWHRAFIDEIFIREPGCEELEVELVVIRGVRGVTPKGIVLPGFPFCPTHST
jgi:hypothetical protein